MPLSAIPSFPTVTPGGQKLSRADDARAWRWRVRSVALSGTYAPGGAVITAQQLGLKRVFGGICLQGVAALATPATAEDIGIIPDGNFTQVTVRLYTSNGAAPAALAEKSAAAVDARSVLVAFLGY